MARTSLSTFLTNMILTSVILHHKLAGRVVDRNSCARPTAVRRAAFAICPATASVYQLLIAKLHIHQDGREQRLVPRSSARESLVGGVQAREEH